MAETRLDSVQRQMFDTLAMVCLNHNRQFSFEVENMLCNPAIIDDKGDEEVVRYLWKEPVLLTRKEEAIQAPKNAVIHGSANDNFEYNYPRTQIMLEALLLNIPLIRKEDGFLRSADTWANTAASPRYTQGISFTFSEDVHYFNATRFSRMERLINDADLIITEEQKARARCCIDRIVKTHLTKYNHQPIYAPQIGRNGVKKILVVDQSYGDFSISCGMASAKTFDIMLQAAISENPDADIIIKTHPDALAKGTERKGGYYSHIVPHDNVYTITETINPISLIKSVDKVYVCTTQLGFEALMCGKEVHTFGMPFYAGWGLTHDYLTCARRTHVRSLEEIFYIAYIMYSFYVNPDRKCRCEIEEAMDYLLKLREEYFAEYGIRNDLPNIEYAG